TRASRPPGRQRTRPRGRGVRPPADGPAEFGCVPGGAIARGRTCRIFPAWCGPRRGAPVRTTTMLRVLHVTSGNLFGGVEVLLLTGAGHRQRCRDREPEFALCFRGRFREALLATGARVHFLGRVRASRPWTVWQARGELRRVLARRNVTVVACHGNW